MMVLNPEWEAKEVPSALRELHTNLTVRIFGFYHRDVREQ